MKLHSSRSDHLLKCELRADVFRVLGAGKFSPKVYLVICPCACRLRGRARTVGRDGGARHFSCTYLHKIVFLRCPCAFCMRRLAQSDPDWILSDVLWRAWWVPLLYGSFWQDLVEILVKSSLRGLCVTLCRSCDKILSRSWWHPRLEVLIWSCTDPYGKIFWKS